MSKEADLAKLKTLLKDKDWRMSNLYWITDQDGNKVKFKPNWVQETLFSTWWFLNIMLKSRQHGITTGIDLWFLDECLFNNNIEAGIIAHRRDDAQKIFRRKVEFPYQNLPDWLKDQRKLLTDSKSEMMFSNKSTIYVDTSARSATLNLLHISEFGKICAKFPDKAEEIVTGALNAVHPGQMVNIESTAEGREGAFYDICQLAEQMKVQGKKLTELDFKFFFFPWWQNPADRLSLEDVKNTVISADEAEYFDDLLQNHGIKLDPGQKAFYVKKKQTQKDNMKREFPSTSKEAFESAIEGAYYATQMRVVRERKQIIKVPYEPSLPVNTGWDLGMNDDMAIVFHQFFKGEQRIIDFYQNNNEGLAFYVRILREKGYIYGSFYLPHDIEVRELGTGISRYETLKSLLPSENLVIVPRIEDINDGIEQVRNFIPNCYFDEEHTNKLVIALDNYRRAWDDKKGVYANKPLHSSASNPADAFRSLAIGLKTNTFARTGKKTAFQPRRTHVIARHMV